MLNKEQVQLAVSAGMELLGENSEISVPIKLNDGIFLLKQLLHLIAIGQMGLQPAVQQELPPTPTPTPPKQPATPTPKKRVANRKKRKQK